MTTLRTLAHAGALALALSTAALGHDADGNPNWITEGAYSDPHNPNIHCCGPADCEIVPATEIRITPQGYVLKGFGDELVPFPEATPSEDRHHWRCKKWDGTRRCFFAPVGGS